MFQHAKYKRLYFTKIGKGLGRREVRLQEGSNYAVGASIPFTSAYIADCQNQDHENEEHCGRKEDLELGQRITSPVNN